MRLFRRNGILIAFAFLLLLTPAAFAEEGTRPADSLEKPLHLRGVDLEGKLHRFAETPDCKAVAVVFLATHCPISNTYLPVLSRMAARYDKRGVEFYGVISDPAVNRADAVRHHREYRLQFPVLFDASSKLRRRLEPTHTPQAIVLSPDGETRYSGRIDDRFTRVGRRKDAADVADLENALEDILAGRKVTVSSTEPVGCLLEDPPSVENEAEVTFNRDIAPLIFTNCSECHRPGEAAPFPLLNYRDVSAHARQIVEVTGERIMPPWHPAEGFGHFRDDRLLADDEIALFRRWVELGKPEGDPEDLPESPGFTKGWRLGRPDLILEMPESFELAAEGADVHQHFVLPTNLRKNRLVSAVEFRPGNPRVVHHASFYLDTTGTARKLDERDPGVGYGSFSGPGFPNAGALRSWLPGMTPRHLPPGTGRLFPARVDLILEIHYQRSGKPETDRSSVGIHFADSSARQLVSEIQVMNKNLIIPAGESRHRHRASYTLPVDATLLDAAPHMHLLGREMKATATLPDGKVKPLVWIKDWDFNWQGQYMYVDPVRLPKGTRIDVDAWYDNSTGNRLNPNSPPRTVTWGEETSDEMGICHFRYTCDSYEEFVTMTSDYLRYVGDQQRKYRRLRERNSRSGR